MIGSFCEYMNIFIDDEMRFYETSFAALTNERPRAGPIGWNHWRMHRRTTRSQKRGFFLLIPREWYRTEMELLYVDYQSTANDNSVETQSRSCTKILVRPFPFLGFDMHLLYSLSLAFYRIFYCPIRVSCPGFKSHFGRLHFGVISRLSSNWIDYLWWYSVPSRQSRVLVSRVSYADCLFW